MTQPPKPIQASPRTRTVLQPESLDLAAFMTPAVALMPTYVDSHTAAEQLPFLFWLLEATHPRVIVDIGATDATAYFGLCQAAGALSRDVRCHLAAIRLEGKDAQGKAKLQEWIEHQNAQHGTRSQIIGGGIGELDAVIEEGVDLLLVHAASVPAEELQRLKTKVFPKLTPHSIVFVDGLGDGPHTFFDELASQGPAFRFPHGDGFGVAVGGPSPPKLLQYLGTCAEDAPSADIIRSLFQRLGQGCRHEVDQRESRRQRRKIRALSEELAQAREDLGIAMSRLVGSEAEINQLRDRLNWNRDQLQKSQQKITALQTEAREEHGRLLQAQGALKEEMHSLQAKLAWSNRTEEGLRAELDTFGRQLQQQEDTAAAAHAESIALREELALVYASRSWRITAPLRKAIALVRG